MSDRDDVYPGPNNPDMFEKDPIKEQIERDAEIFASDYGMLAYGPRDIYEKCATAQDKIATNRTVKAVKGLLKKWGMEDVFIKELEKLRRV